MIGLLNSTITTLQMNLWKIRVFNLYQNRGNYNFYALSEYRQSMFVDNNKLHFNSTGIVTRTQSKVKKSNNRRKTQLSRGSSYFDTCRTRVLDTTSHDLYLSKQSNAIHWIMFNFVKLREHNRTQSTH